MPRASKLLTTEAWLLLNDRATLGGGKQTKIHKQHQINFTTTHTKVNKINQIKKAYLL
jgi:hypothetical protein